MSRSGEVDPEPITSLLGVSDYGGVAPRRGAASGRIEALLAERSIEALLAERSEASSDLEPARSADVPLKPQVTAFWRGVGHAMSQRCPTQMSHYRTRSEGHLGGWDIYIHKHIHIYI